MLIKKSDNKTAVLAELEALVSSADRRMRREIENELRKLRAGLKAEREAAYLIDFDYGNSPDMAVLHDLRLEIDGRVAQIDHLLIHRSMHCFVLETKHVQAGLKITESGEFLRWDPMKKNFEGMPSPLAQNERHIAVLRDALRGTSLPPVQKDRLVPVLHSYVLVPPKARIDRPSNFDTARVIKMDLLRSTIDRDLAKLGAPKEDATTARAGLEHAARQLAALHRPAAFDYQAKFRLPGSRNHHQSASAAGLYSGGENPYPSLARVPNSLAGHPRKTANRPVARIARLAIAGTLLLAGFTVAQGFSPAAPLAWNVVDFLGSAKALVNSWKADPLISPAQIRAKDEEPPAVQLQPRSLTATGRTGDPIAEIQGDLPRIRREMRQSRLGAEPVRPEGKTPAECRPKPVMTDEEIANCRELAGHQLP